MGQFGTPESQKKPNSICQIKSPVRWERMDTRVWQPNQVSDCTYSVCVGWVAGFWLAAACFELGLAVALPTYKTSGECGLVSGWRLGTDRHFQNWNWLWCWFEWAPVPFDLGGRCLFIVRWIWNRELLPYWTLLNPTCISFVYSSPFQVCADLPTTTQCYRASVFVSLCWCWLGRKASLICSDLLPPSQWSIREIRCARDLHGLCGLVWITTTSDLVNWASAVVASCDCYSGLRFAELSGALIQFGSCVDPLLDFE